MTQRQQIHLLTVARRKVEKLKKQEDEIYGKLIKQLNFNDHRSFLFDYIFNGSFPASTIARWLNDEAKIKAELGVA